MGMMMVDQGYDRPPELRRDPFWEGTHPLYSEETSRIPNHVQQGSASQVKLAGSTSEIIMMPILGQELEALQRFPQMPQFDSSLHFVIIPSLNRARIKTEEKPPVVILETIQVEPSPVNELIPSAQTSAQLVSLYRPSRPCTVRNSCII
ncbi:hypothetical protein OSTOST_18441 [Ostertagia ostertagi]